MWALMWADQHSKDPVPPFLLDEDLTCGIATAKFLILVDLFMFLIQFFLKIFFDIIEPTVVPNF